MKRFKVFEDMKSKIPEGATHYFNETDEDFFAWVKFNGDTAYMMMPNSKCFSDWTLCNRDAIFKNSNKIPKTRTRTEYIKITDSIFDLRPDFEAGELYSKHKNKEKYYQINTEAWVVSAMNNNNLYRRIEKEIDDRQEFVERANDLVSKSHAVDFSLGKMYDAGCRFVGANGEIE